MSSPKETTTAAPDNTTGFAETVVPDMKIEKATTTAEAPTTAAPGVAAPAQLPQSKVDYDSPPIKSLWTHSLWRAAKAHAHNEIWGVELADPETHIPSQIVFQKYLNANDQDLEKAKDQLIKTLDWRMEHEPLELLRHAYSAEKFEGLGYVTTHSDNAAMAEPDGREVFTWNIYGKVKDINTTFGDLKDFINWRVALMELAISALNLPTAATPITDTFDPYKIYQVHDYKSISFFRQSSSVKSASTETIKVFAQNYPELLKEKFFVNVPAVMGFVYGLMKLFVAPKTIKKFHPMSNGGALNREFDGSKVKGLGEMLPAEYGGKGEGLDVQGKVVKTEKTEKVKEEAAVAA